jgi:hypothetical protein
MTTVPDVTMILPPEVITNYTIAGNADIATTKLAQRVLAESIIPLTQARTWDSVAVNLPASASSDDLGLVSGTFGTNPARITAGDVKALGATTRRLYMAIPIPANYEDGQTIQLQIRAKMETTVADVSCTLDAEAYVGADGSLSSDLVTTPAQSMNSLTAAAYNFTINATGVDPGDLLEVRLSIASNDAATATAVTPAIYSIALLCDTRG